MAQKHGSSLAHLSCMTASCCQPHEWPTIPRLPQAKLLGVFLPLTPSEHIASAELTPERLSGQAGAVSLVGLFISPTQSHRYAWSGFAKQRLWSKCIASWTRHPSGISRTSRTPEGPGEKLPCWGSRLFLYQNCETRIGLRMEPTHSRSGW